LVSTGSILVWCGTTIAYQPSQPVIVTTKEGRFVNQLLQQQGVQMPEQWIIGKESKRPKPQLLRELIGRTEMPLCLWFVEDRLKPCNW